MVINPFKINNIRVQKITSKKKRSNFLYMERKKRKKKFFFAIVQFVGFEYQIMMLQFESIQFFKDQLLYIHDIDRGRVYKNL